MYFTLIRDTRYALRGFKRNPGFTVAAVLSLALGIGATTAIFSVASGVLLQSLPYRDPERLVTISLDGAITAPLFDTFRREARSIEQGALFVNSSFNMRGETQPIRVDAARVSAGLFELLGVSPISGRTFTVEEDQRGRDHVVLIGDALWKSQFGGDPGVLNRTVILDGAPHTIIGIMPPGFLFPYGPELPRWAGNAPPAQIWRPMALAGWESTCKGCFNFAMVARLRSGVTPAQARVELIGILKRIDPKYAAEADPVTVVSLHDAVTQQVRTPVLILFSAVCLALLIACVNVANLLLARGLQRQAEFALRLSLGARPWRIAQQMLTEALTLAVCAAMVAVPLAWAAIRGILALAPAGIPRLDTVGLDTRMLGFALAASLLSAIVFGAAPAFLAARNAPGESLRAGGRGATAGPQRLRATLVVAEIALSLTLLVGAGLLGKSFVNVSQTPLGFQAENILTMRMNFSRDPNPAKDKNVRFIDQLVDNCSKLPGVISASAVSTLPLTGQSEGWGLATEDNPNDYTSVRVRAVTPDYFRTMGIQLRMGREFTPNDRGDNPVVILTQSAARKLWPGGSNPVGRRIKSKNPMTVIGIVDDTRASGLDSEVRPYLYLPFWQFAPDAFALAIRTSANPAALAASVKQEVWRMDKDLPVTHVAAMRQLVADSIAPRRFQASLMTVLGAFALALAAVGIYGVLSYTVMQRTHEFGIRMALGATRRHVLGVVFRQAGVLALAGIAIGAMASAWFAPAMRGLLYGVDPMEVSVFATCGTVLLIVAAAAGVVPARRASKLDPMQCLRDE